MFARLLVAGVRLAVHPGAVSLERDHHVRRSAEQLAVMADDQNRLARAPDRALERALRRNVEEVVGLVEEQDLRIALEQRGEHQLLALAARQRTRRPVADLGQSVQTDPAARRVPATLELIAAQLRPVADRFADLETGRVIPGRRRALCVEQPPAGRAQSCRRGRQQQLANGPALSAVLRHVRHPPAAGHGPLEGIELSARIRSSVLLPMPLTPTSAAWRPRTRRNDTSLNRSSPPGCA